jgi:hypothetical protein
MKDYEVGGACNRSGRGEKDIHILAGKHEGKRQFEDLGVDG